MMRVSSWKLCALSAPLACVAKSLGRATTAPEDWRRETVQGTVGVGRHFIYAGPTSTVALSNGSALGAHGRHRPGRVGLAGTTPGNNRAVDNERVGGAGRRLHAPLAFFPVGWAARRTPCVPRGSAAKRAACASTPYARLTRPESA
ncbi:unnamed protein product, partial [Iphiclides podalirius]